MSAIEGAAGETRADAGETLARLATGWKLAAGMTLFAVLQQCLGHHNADNSWLIDVCEKMLDGARPYVDVIETNPPAAFLLYMPAVALARLVGLPAEFVVSACVFAGAFASFALAGRVARAAGLIATAELAVLGNAAVFALVLTPGFSFAEREHIAALSILPALAVYAARAGGRPVARGRALAAGLLAGLAMSIKPHFALAVLAPLSVALVWRRSLRPAFGIENFAAAGVVLCYVAVTFLWFPDFFTVLPSILDAYVPVKEPLADLLLEPWFLVNLALLAAVALALSRGGADARILVLASASAGFLGAFLVQGKGWVNHGLPGVALAFLALALALAPSLASGLRHKSWAGLRRVALFVAAPAAVGLPILFGTIIQITMHEEYPGLTEAVRRHAPARPKIIAVSGELDLGHPLTRRVGGVWAGSPHSLWLMLSARVLIDWKRGDAARLAAYEDSDARMFARDMRENRPDIVLVGEGERVRGMLRHPAIAGALADFEIAETVSGVAVMARKAVASIR